MKRRSAEVLFDAEFSVRLSMFSWPTIFPSRERVLDHYFLVIGNGYEWREGGLWTAHSPFEKKIAEMMAAGKSDREIWAAVHEEHMRQYKTGPSKNFGLESVSPELAKEFEKIHVPDLPPKPEKFNHPYPLCQFSKLLTVPEDVRTDWFELWKEALDLARRLPLYPNPESYQDGEFVPSEDEAKLGNRRQMDWVIKAEDRARKLGLYEPRKERR